MNNISNKGISKIVLIGALVIIVIGAGLAYYLLTPPAEQASTITTGGASFPYPLITKWTFEYNRLHPLTQISYQSIGSGGGQNNLFSKTFDFAGSDAPLSNSQMANYTGILHIPETCGGIVIAYNLPGIAKGLNLTSDVIAKIFLGNITKWNDPALIALNPSVNLPNNDIVTIHRSDSSGTTYAFTDYLTNVSSLWASSLGIGKTVAWPVGIGAPQNSGVASSLSQTQYSIGYLEFFYAANNLIPYANIQNLNGKFIEPTLQTISNAASAGTSRLSSDIRSSIVNLPGENVYPISAFTYILVYKDLSYMDQAKAQAIANFLYWIVHDGQNFSEGLLYPKLPNQIVSMDDTILRQLVYQGRNLL